MALFLESNSIESFVFRQLILGPLDTKTLLHRSIAAGNSRSGTYYAVSRLKEQKIVASKKQILCLHPNTTERIYEQTRKIEQSYQGIDYPFNPSTMTEGESHTMNFSSLQKFLNMWNCYYSFFTKHTNPTKPFVTYQDNDWMTAYQTEFETRTNNITERAGKNRIDIVATRSPFGEEIKERHYKNYSRIQHELTGKPHTATPGNYINIFEDNVIEAKININLAHKIECIFKQKNTLNSPKKLKELLGNTSGKFRLRVTASHNLAERSGRKIMRDF